MRYKRNIIGLTDAVAENKTLTILWFRRWRLVDLLLVIVVACGIAGLMPDRNYLAASQLAGKWLALDNARLGPMLQEARVFAGLMAAVAFAAWALVRRLHAELTARLQMRSVALSVLVQLHFLFFLPAVAYWFYYSYRYVTAPEEAWREEVKVVPWHRDFDEVMERCRMLIPEGDGVLVSFRGPGTASYVPFVNARLYPRKVFVANLEEDGPPGNESRRTRYINKLRASGIRWVVNYRGPREFDSRQFTVDRLP